jgi:hypothetical protein
VRQAVIDRDNGLLLDKLLAIQTSKASRITQATPAMPCRWCRLQLLVRLAAQLITACCGSLNLVGRQQELLRISHENQAIATRLGATTSEYSRADWVGLLFDWKMGVEEEVTNRLGLAGEPVSDGAAPQAAHCAF